MTQRSSANLVDFLSIAAARLHRTIGKPAVAQLTFRMTPGESLAATSILMTKSQLLRLRNDINAVLHDPDGWLFDPNDAAIRGRDLELPSELSAFFEEPTTFESPADTAKTS